MYLSMLIWLFPAVSGSDDVFIRTRLGQVHGKRNTNNYGFATSTVDTFLRIPYAKPPVKKLRFMDPVPSHSWTGVLDGTTAPPACPQINCSESTGAQCVNVQDEDCLYMNIYRPRMRNGSALFPVMVYIHGGSLLYGSANDYNGLVLASKGLVIVTVNYRLSVLGFLSSGDDHLPGNFGFLDQVQALRWIRDNIADYSGDPSSVTLFGCSAGAAQIGLHLLSPLSEGLFRQVIMQSGTINAHWAKPSAKSYFPDLFHTFAWRMDCGNHDSIIGKTECLRQKSYRELIDRYHESGMHYTFRGLDLRPFLDGRVLTDKLNVVLSRPLNKNVSIIIGVTEHESLRMFYNSLKTSLVNGISPESFGDRLNQVFHLMKPSILETIRFHYTDWRRRDDPHMYSEKLIQAATDMEFVAPAVYLACRLREQGLPVYFYQFSKTLPYRKGHIENYYDNKSYHGIELPFVFGYPFSGEQSPDVWHQGSYSDDDRKFSSTVMELWASFAKYGVPGAPDLTWFPFQAKTSDYLSLGTKSEMRQHLRPMEVEFWNRYIPTLYWFNQESTESHRTYQTEMWIFIIMSMLLMMMLVILISVMTSRRGSRCVKRGAARFPRGGEVMVNKERKLFLTYKDSDASVSSQMA